MITAVLIPFILVLIFFTILSSTYFEVWWIRGTDFPRLQFTAIGIILLILESLFFDFTEWYVWVLFGCTLASILYHCSWIWPYTRFYPHQVLSTEKKDPENTISILVANVLQTNTRYEDLLKIVRENCPHILITLETNKEWQKHLDELEDEYPHTVKCPLENLYGMHVYSKLPLFDAKIQFLEMDDIPSIHTQVSLPSKKKITMHFMHPIPPRPSQTGESSQRDAELLVVGKRIAGRDEPVIVTGDMNDVAWSKTTRLFLQVSHLLDPRVGRGMFNSFNAFHWFLRWPLDHLFHSDHFTLSRLERLPKFGSDHFPVLIELVYDESKRKAQKPPEATEEEKQIMKEKIDSEEVEVSDVHSPSSTKEG